VHCQHLLWGFGDLDHAVDVEPEVQINEVSVGRVGDDFGEHVFYLLEALDDVLVEDQLAREKLFALISLPCPNNGLRLLWKLRATACIC
jgi:hypothetical protein